MSLLRAVRAQAEDNSLRQDRLDDMLEVHRLHMLPNSCTDLMRQRAQTALADMGAMQGEFSQTSNVLRHSVSSLSVEVRELCTCL